ncbi:hypothetical protein BP6252_05002 [Coleophoma cylindrospora]|uniref:Xylanolytic transcriptional activator regulatory domain-containing protein n=1 Tax=Coleophoma cylindrospora TaxID=1849047 RepID=A0A3D8RSC8_9HELO|nr:hypothetical protein BP6252_05002 [Coleophoma cylindrospora]
MLRTLWRSLSLKKTTKSHVLAEASVERSLPELDSHESRSEIYTQLHDDTQKYILEQEGFKPPLKITQIENVATLAQPKSSQSSCSHLKYSETTLPGVFTPFPSHLDIADLAYLKSRDALTIPDKTTQLELLKGYIQGVHSTLPILDLKEFLSRAGFSQLLLTESSNLGKTCEVIEIETISFLLFQAVLFAGVEYVSSKVLRQAGYRDRKSAKRIFFRRVRLLYDFDTCNDHISMVQSLLLMSLCPPCSQSQKEGKGARHWLGLAVSMAINLGLNRDKTKFGSLSHRLHLKRRIWWTAFVRDRTLALDIGGYATQRFAIRREDCEMDMLSLHDFELDQPGIRHETTESLVLSKRAADVVERVLLCWNIETDLVARTSSCCFKSSAQITPALQEQAEPVSSNNTPTSSSSLNSDLARGEIWDDSEDIEEWTSSSPSIINAYVNEQSSQESSDSILGANFVHQVGFCNGSGHDVVGEYEDYLEYFNFAMVE